jgi:hypothetical protein
MELADTYDDRRPVPAHHTGNSMYLLLYSHTYIRIIALDPLARGRPTIKYAPIHFMVPFSRSLGHCMPRLLPYIQYLGVPVFGLPPKKPRCNHFHSTKDSEQTKIRSAKNMDIAIKSN